MEMIRNCAEECIYTVSYSDSEQEKHMFGKKRQIQTVSYDKENQIPILKCSICNGEQVAGFKDIRTGKFEEVMLVRNNGDLEAFKMRYGVETIRKEY